MKNEHTAIALAIGAAITALSASAQVTQPNHPEKPTYEYEKCYGVARALRNDCFTRANSCGGTVTQDQRPDAWIYLPAGTCEKIVGGGLKPA